MRARLVASATTVLLVLGVAPLIERTRPVALACWNLSPYPMFLLTSAPDDERFYSGRLGILQPSYSRSALAAAWRTLSGRPLQEGERRAFLPDRSTVPSESASEIWRRARQSVPGAPGGYVFQETFLAPTYAYVLNCGDSALLTAARTLEARRATLGPGSHEFTAWVTAQDLVFNNCARRPNQPPTIPEPLGPEASSLARADRAYQIAAAQLYAGQFSEAEAGFTAIGADAQSPWRQWGPYLAARAMIRQATMGGQDAEGDSVAAVRARDALKAVMADPSQSDLHRSAEGLLQYLEARSDPPSALRKVSAAMALPERDGDAFTVRLNDFRILMYHFWSRPDAGEALAPVRQSSELVDWLVTLEVASPEAEDHAVSRWNATKSEPWLVAALIKVDSGHARQNELLAAAAAVPESSPAYLTVAFNRARLLLLSGAREQARDVLGRALASSDVPASAANLLKAARLTTAQTLDQFLKDASRTPILEQGVGTAALDADSIDVLNEQIPLAQLQQIAARSLLPSANRIDLLCAIFARAVLLRNAPAVREAIPPLAKARTELGPALAPLRSATSDEELLDEARLLLLAHPGVHPFMAAGSFRRTRFFGGGEPLALTAIDSLRDNWWCSFAPTPDYGVSYETSFNRRGYARRDPVMAAFRPQPNERDRLPFLSEADSRQAEVEWAALQKIDTAPNELGSWAIRWVDAHPNDPRAPMVLYQVVRATRYGCTNSQTGAISHRAFSLLHSRYPTSEWAKKTPYWFK